MFKFEFYVPLSHLEKVKKAIFEAGSGMIGNYSDCSWQIEGLGQFLPLKNSKPHVGKTDELEVLKEWKVELVLSEENMAHVLLAFKDSHPYEEPAFNIIKLVDPNTFI